MSDGARRGFAYRHRVPEVGMGVDRRGDDDPSDRPLAAAATFRTACADLGDPPVAETNVGRSRALDVQNGTYDEHPVFAGKLPAT